MTVRAGLHASLPRHTSTRLPGAELSRIDTTSLLAAAHERRETQQSLPLPGAMVSGGECGL